LNDLSKIPGIPLAAPPALQHTQVSEIISTPEGAQRTGVTPYYIFRRPARGLVQPLEVTPWNKMGMEKKYRMKSTTPISRKRRKILLQQKRASQRVRFIQQKQEEES